MNQGSLSNEEREFLKAAEEYAELAACPGWKRLLDEIEKDADVALGQLRECKSDDPVRHSNLASEWRRQEKFLEELHVKVFGAIKHRDEFLKQLSDESRRSIMEELNG